MTSPIDIILPGSAKSTGPLRTCGKCDTEKKTEGGVNMGPGRWYCAACWRSFRSRK